MKSFGSKGQRKGKSNGWGRQIAGTQVNGAKKGTKKQNSSRLKRLGAERGGKWDFDSTWLSDLRVRSSRAELMAIEHTGKGGDLAFSTGSKEMMI